MLRISPEPGYRGSRYRLRLLPERPSQRGSPILWCRRCGQRRGPGRWPRGRRAISPGKMPRQPVDARVLEQVGDAAFQTKFLAKAQIDRDRRQRVRPKLEKRCVGIDRLAAQSGGNNGADRPGKIGLYRWWGGNGFGCRFPAGQQRGTIHLAVAGQRQRVQHGDAPRYHVGGFAPKCARNASNSTPVPVTNSSNCRRPASACVARATAPVTPR